MMLRNGNALMSVTHNAEVSMQTYGGQHQKLHSYWKGRRFGKPVFIVRDTYINRYVHIHILCARVSHTFPRYNHHTSSKGIISTETWFLDFYNANAIFN